MKLAVEVEPELAGLTRLGLASVESLSVREADPALAQERERAGRELRERHAGLPASQLPGVDAARALSRSLGLDPTRQRPSNEALLRRVLKGEPLYQVNTLVDAVNLVSLRHQLPFGLYDLERVAPPLALRRGRAGEAYAGIRKGEIHAEGRPVLCDASGPFGNPSADSQRTAIGLTTRSALVVAWAPARHAPSELARAVADAVAAVERHCGGRARERCLLPSADAPAGWR